LWLKTLYRKRAVTWPFIFYTIIWTLSKESSNEVIKTLYFSALKKNFFSLIIVKELTVIDEIINKIKVGPT
ncbi:hypothetical protein, partial [Enterococcus faecalis]|uniref:hypothetical protein n=1 Tax=Enterococcus faecalis TaxID=1351 RepID=UPI001EE94832